MAMTALGEAPGGRLPAVDIARSAAILGMVIYHFTYDLALFGLLAPGTPFTLFWASFARAVAGSFLFLVGVGLWLGHGRGIRAGRFVRRLGIIAGAAAAVSAATYAAQPDRFVFFGILHSIAVASVLGLAFLRLPAGVTALAGIAVLVLPQVYRSEVFAAPWLLWSGLAPSPPLTLDYEPVFPWFAPCLFGIAAARAADRAGWLARLRAEGPPSRAMRLLAWPGRHSLAIYLLHQPVLIGFLWLAVQLIR